MIWLAFDQLGCYYYVCFWAKAGGIPTECVSIYIVQIFVYVNADLLFCVVCVCTILRSSVASLSDYARFCGVCFKPSNYSHIDVGRKCREACSSTSSGLEFYLCLCLSINKYNTIQYKGRGLPCWCHRCHQKLHSFDCSLSQTIGLCIPWQRFL